MYRLFAIAFVAVTLGWSGSVFAADEYRAVGQGPRRVIETPWLSSISAVCAAVVQTVNDEQLPSNPPISWNLDACPSEFPGIVVIRRLVGGVSGDLTFSFSLQNRPAQDVCGALAGTPTLINRTEGWARTSNPSASDRVIDSPPTSAGMCDGQCVVAVKSVDSCWRSQVPASNGLHRLSCDYKGVITAAQCKFEDSPATDPASAPAPCPGTLGNVNGKPVCFGTGTSPLPANPAPAGTPPEGFGNPSAGPKPSSGSGSGDGPGRTPVSGNGGNSGGGSSAATPGGGSDGNGQGNGTPRDPGTGAGGEGTNPDPVEVCGLPGKAPCKIDETGTGNGDGAFNGAKGELTTAGQGAIDGINNAAGAGDKNTGWGFGFSLPAGCAPLVLAEYNIAVNMCEWTGVIHDLMAMIWLIATSWCCIGMVGAAMRGD